jgi:hypothetical protein
MRVKKRPTGESIVSRDAGDCGEAGCGDQKMLASDRLRRKIGAKVKLLLFKPELNVRPNRNLSSSDGAGSRKSTYCTDPSALE